MAAQVNKWSRFVTSLTGLRSIGLGLLFALCLSVPLPAVATYYCVDCTCIVLGQTLVQTYFIASETGTQLYFGTAEPIDYANPGQESGIGDLGDYQTWMAQTFFDDYVLSALQDMAEQFTDTMMMQTLAVGAMIDAKTQLETQTLFQQLAAQAHKDYQPSLSMCVFGTNVRSLAAADDNAYMTETMLSEREQQRELQKGGNLTATGPVADRQSRMQQFTARYCDKLDNDPAPGVATSGLALICSASAGAASVDKDIDYLRTILLPRTLQIDFAPPGNGTANLTGDAQDVLAMSANLYSHKVFENMSDAAAGIGNNQQVYLALRAVVAKRSVAETSFNAIAAMKSQASTESTDTAKYMTVLMQELGMPAADIVTFLGDRPSYMAQMEVLAKKIYQRPEFYTELYDTPVNVKRRSVAMQAIGLMLDRDIYKSYLRSEAIMSVLLEARLAPEHAKVSDDIATMNNQAPHE